MQSPTEASAVIGHPQRMPTAFVPHGGGPWPFVDTGIGSPAELEALASYLRGVSALPKAPPQALLVVSAHWEEPVATVMTGTQPPMLYDYFGFPADSYKITWPAPGNPSLARRVQELLQAAGLPSATNDSRGFDHGTFVPLKLAYPEAQVPTVQLSLKRGLDPSEHLAIGRALQPLRDEGVFIVGSGMSYHNLRGFGRQSSVPESLGFDAWLDQAMKLEPTLRDAALRSWTEAPFARAVHPREEHLLPLMVIAGAAGDDAAQLSFRGSILGLAISGYHFG